MSKIKFSVLMSVYKNDKPSYLKDAINSVMNQTLKPNQVVIMVDGPIGDNLKDVLNEYEDNKIIDIIYKEENEGLGITLNRGLNYCKYDYVARMDSDDICESNRFEVEIGYLEKNNDIDVVGSLINEYDETMSRIISTRIVPENDDEIKEYLKKRNPMNHVSVIYKKEKVLEVGSYEDYLFFEDYHLWSKMIKNNCKFHNIQLCLVKVRGGDSMFKRRGGKAYLNHIKRFEKFLLDQDLINK